MHLLGLAVSVALSLALRMAPGPAPRVPEPAETLRALHALSPDPAPAQVTNGIHYVTSNERRLDLFLPELARRGGALLGVGSDQNYILAGWSRPELMVIVDFDQAVVDMHAIDAALFQAAATPGQFVALWAPDHADQAKQAIRDATPSRARRATLLARYDASRAEVAKRNAVMLAKYDELGIHWVLEDQQQYDAVRTLAIEKRIIAVRGDFTVDGVVARIGALLAAAELPVGVLYLSNIEQYFMYGKAFRHNMLGLPLNADSLVLRTLPGRPAGFQYIVQAGDNFRAWLGAKRVYSVYKLRGLGPGEHLEASEKYIIDALP